MPRNVVTLSPRFLVLPTRRNRETRRVIESRLVERYRARVEKEPKRIEIFPIVDSEVREHWQVLQRRGSSVPISPRLIGYIAERKLHAARWEGALERGDPQTTLLWGMSDPRSGPHIVEHVRQRVPTARIRPLPDVGHYPQLEVPKLVVEEIAGAFLKE